MESVDFVGVKQRMKLFRFFFCLPPRGRCHDTSFTFKFTFPTQPYSGPMFSPCNTWLSKKLHGNVFNLYFSVEKKNSGLIVIHNIFFEKQKFSPLGQ